jgi:hypothetical protein
MALFVGILKWTDFLHKNAFVAEFLEILIWTVPYAQSVQNIKKTFLILSGTPLFPQKQNQCFRYGLHKVFKAFHRDTGPMLTPQGVQSVLQGHWPHVDSTRCSKRSTGTLAPCWLHKVFKAFYRDTGPMLTPTLPRVVSNWLDVDPFCDTHGETVECEKPISVAHSNRCAWHFTTLPRSKKLQYFVLPIHHLNGTHTQCMSRGVKNIYLFINLFNPSPPLHLHGLKWSFCTCIKTASLANYSPLV